MLTPGTYLQNRYEILERIGSGGMSVVYKARCHTLDRLVAIKVLKEEFAFDENFVSKFKMEAQSAARLSHPNIVSVYDVVDEDVYHYIVMELIEGITLKNYIENKGYLESKEAIGIALQVGQGIAAAHEQHIIHRDIKPQNMIISRDGKVKVADFGIARAVSSQTMNATAVGSVHYISPEQARGGYCDERSDIYSFGITMYEMVTGRVPFEGDNTVTVALAHLEEPVTPPSQYVPDMSRAMEQIILKCTQKRPDRRYACVTDVIEDLRAALMDPDADIYARKDGEEDEFGKTRPITRDELNSIQEGRKSYPEEALEEPEEEQPGHQDRNRAREPRKKEGRIHTRKKNEGDDVSTQFERIITAFGIVAAIIIVAVVLFVFSRLTGIFRQGSNKPTTETVSMTTEDSTTVVDINTEDQINMPSVLGLPQDMAREKLKESSLVMEITGSEYSDNYTEGQVMGQDILAGTVVKKWSTVGVTISKGSDKVDLNALDLTQMTGEDARLLLEQKGLVVEVREENSDTAIKGNVIRFSPQVVKVGESVSLYVSKGSQNVEGRVPNLQGQTPTSADALLAGAGLLTGNVTVEASDTVEEGLIISQSELPGTILPPGTAVDYVVSGEPAQTQAADERYYIGSIDEACSLSNYIGPASQTSSVRVLNVIRFSPQVVKVGESVSLYVSKGSQNVEGRVPNLQGQTPTSADALLAGAGLLTGNVTVEASDTVEEGLIISQSELPGTILPPGTAVDYVVSGEPAQTQAADERYYIGSIDEACSLSNYIGPASQTSSVRVLIRLNQTNDEGASVYTTLMSPRLVVGAQTVPVVFPRIKGAYGVDSGMVEVVDADNLTVIKSYPVAFFPVG